MQNLGDLKLDFRESFTPLSLKPCSSDSELAVSGSGSDSCRSCSHFQAGMLFVSDKLAVYVGLNGDICFSLLPLVLMAISLLLQVLR